MMVEATGQHDLLAAQCSCSQCGQNLSSMTYQRRVAHIKRCEPPSYLAVQHRKCMPPHTSAQLMQKVYVEDEPL